MLIQITDHRGQQVVSARGLHSFLLSKKDFSAWIKHRITKYGLVEDQDYVIAPPKSGAKKGGQNAIEYGLTLDAAKELAMVEGNTKGKEARQYFIEMEKKAKVAPASMPQTQGEMILMMAQGFVEQERQMKELGQRVTEIEAKTATRPEYMTIMGFAILQGVQIGLTTAATIGRKAAKICKEKNYPIEKIKDPRFGLVGSYPEKVLKQIFSETI